MSAAGVRSLLARRAASNRGESAAALLACLERIDAIGGDLGEVAACLERAGRLVCFRPEPGDRDEPPFRTDYGPVPSLPEGSLLARLESSSAERRELHRALEDLLRRLVFEADVQAYVDAAENERTLLRAAGAVARAAAELARHEP